jgi:hypothetical protein
MRLATPLAVLALAAGLLAGCGGSSSESSGTNSTSHGARTSTAPAGASVRACSLDVAGVRSLRAAGVSCREAQKVALAWERGSGCVAAPGASHSACSVRGYRCIGTAAGRGLAVSCARPGRAVAFTVRRG